MGYWEWGGGWGELSDAGSGISSEIEISITKLNNNMEEYDSGGERRGGEGWEGCHG